MSEPKGTTRGVALPAFAQKLLESTGWRARFALGYAIVVLLLAAFWASVYCMYMGMDDPFLYFRF